MNKKRKEAMEWWNEMSTTQKTGISDMNADVLGSNRHWESLTGREIEMLYFNGCFIFI